MICDLRSAASGGRGRPAANFEACGPSVKERTVHMFLLKRLLYLVSRTAHLVIGILIEAAPETIHGTPESAATNNGESEEDTPTMSFEILYRVSDVVRIIFGRLDSSSLALAACTCRAWRDAARVVRGPGTKFRLQFSELLGARPAALIWAVEHLNSRRLPDKLRATVCARAARGGCLEIVQWARNGNYGSWDWRVCVEAARGGHLEIIQWARRNGCEWNWLVCANAARGGHFELLKWARDNGCAWNQSVCEGAAAAGHLEMLQWARTNGCEWNEDRVCAEAAENGHLGILQWMLEAGARRGWQLCAHAAMSGNLKVIQWARENGFAWDRHVCVYAARNGHLEVLQWLRANGCPWDQNECWTEAEYCGHRAIAAWIKTQSE
jgi:hypothetical protein